ncbi:MAG: hypothetical protein U0795_09235 [Pirellulales bacterium]
MPRASYYRKGKAVERLAQRKMSVQPRALSAEEQTEVRQVLDHRHQVMQAAYARHPDRFVQGCPRPKQVPPAVWIKPPATSPTSEKNAIRALECTPKPLASLTHPRLGYPSSSCVVRRGRLRFTKFKSNQ